MTTPLFLLRCVQLGISIADLDLLTIGLVTTICSRRNRTTTIHTKSWQVSRISTDSKEKNRRLCLYCERNKHNRLVILVSYFNQVMSCSVAGF